MGNCLKTQLKESVQSSGLSKIGELKFVFVNGDNVSSYGTEISIRHDTDCTVRANRAIITGTNLQTFDTPVDTYTKPSYLTINCTVGRNDDTLFVKDLYNLINVQFNNNWRCDDINSLKYAPNLEQLIHRGSTEEYDPELSVSTFNSWPSLVKFDRCAINGSISDLRSNTHLVIFINVKDTISGNTNLLATKFPNLENLQLLRGSTKINAMNTTEICKLANLATITATISGTAEDLVARYRGKNRTSGDINLLYCGGITFQGVEVRNNTHLIWDSNTITCDGVTINNDTVIS